MDDPSNDTFCSLDLLAEVAAATLQNDLSLISNYYWQGSNNNAKVSGLQRKSINSSEKLTLDQIKCLSEKNLIEMFSEHICDEMKKNYSFQCYLIPDECTQIFKSFGNETRARAKIKAHLLNHIKELIAAANESNNQEMFMAEPLHVRRKRLKEANRKTTRRKKQTRPLCNRYQKDSSYESFLSHAESLNCFNSESQLSTNTSKLTALNSASNIDFDSWSSGFKQCLSENISNDNICDTSNQLKYLDYSDDDASCVDADQVLLNNWSSGNDPNSNFPESHVRKKQKSKYSDVYEPNSLQQLNSNYENKPYINCDVLSESEPCSSIHHDHNYTFMNIKICENEPSFSGESSKPPINKLYKDTFQPKRHRCARRESPLIIPTPPFPYVYNPVLPHIALIQEVGQNLKPSGCKCKNTDDIEGLWDCGNRPKVSHHSYKGYNCLRNSRKESILDNTRATYVQSFGAPNRNNSAARNFELSRSSICPDMYKSQCKNINVVE